MDREKFYSVILQGVKTDLEQILAERSGEQASYPDQTLLGIIFKNYRIQNGRAVGLRLSYLGNRLLSKKYTSYSFLQDEKPSNKVLILLDKNMIWPYYVTKTVATFYSENDAAWFKLNGEKLKDYVEYL